VAFGRDVALAGRRHPNLCDVRSNSLAVLGDEAATCAFGTDGVGRATASHVARLAADSESVIGAPVSDGGGGTAR